MIVWGMNLFINLSIFIEFFSNSKSSPLILNPTDSMLPVLRPHQTSPKDFLAPSALPSWKGFQEDSAQAQERILANAGKCVLQHRFGGQFRLRREKIDDR